MACTLLRKRCTASPPPAFSPDASCASLPFSSVCLGPGFHFFRCGVPRASQPCNTRQPSVPAAREDIPKINGNADQRPHPEQPPRRPGTPSTGENRNDAGTRQHNCATTPTKKGSPPTFPVPQDEPDERADRGKQRVRPHRNAQKCCGLLNDRRVGNQNSAENSQANPSTRSDVPRAAPAERMIAFHNPSSARFCRPAPMFWEA